MKLIKSINLLLVSIILQTLLLPFRLITYLFRVIEAISRVIKKTTNFFIEQLTKEVLFK